jgi:hypothetical protein
VVSLHRKLAEQVACSKLTSVGCHCQTRGNVSHLQPEITESWLMIRYTLRFRCFDITAVPSESATPSPSLVSAYSQPFTVYSPRKCVSPHGQKEHPADSSFPGIPKPTELAEHFNRLGFKLNTRKVSEPSASTAKAAAALALRQNDRTITESSPSSSSDTARRPSPQPIQHQERAPSSLGRYSTSAAQNNTSSSTDMGSESWSSATDTGTMTAPSSTGGSGMLSGGSGGLGGDATVAMPGALPPSGGVGSAGLVRTEREQPQ